MYEIERFSISRHERAGAGRMRARPERLQVAWEKPVEGHPDEAGQARLQMSRHAKWWGYRWSKRARSSPCALADSTW